MSGQIWHVVNKKKKSNHIIPEINSFDTIISRQKEKELKNYNDKQTYNQKKYDEPKDFNQDWVYIPLNKIKLKSKTILPQKESSSIKESDDGNIKIKKVSSQMSQTVINAKKWNQIQLAKNSNIDVKIIREIERSGSVYDSNIFNDDIFKDDIFL
jgi:ribosome-binding protein aMBF1 (putative translation factor)